MLQSRKASNVLYHIGEELITCPFCCNIYTDPRLMPCYNVTLCHRCQDSHMTQCVECRRAANVVPSCSHGKVQVTTSENIFTAALVRLYWKYKDILAARSKARLVIDTWSAGALSLCQCWVYRLRHQLVLDLPFDTYQLVLGLTVEPTYWTVKLSHAMNLSNNYFKKNVAKSHYWNWRLNTCLLWHWYKKNWLITA